MFGAPFLFVGAENKKGAGSIRLPLLQVLPRKTPGSQGRTIAWLKSLCIVMARNIGVELCDNNRLGKRKNRETEYNFAVSTHTQNYIWQIVNKSKL